MTVPVIAIDGPGGAGKGTVSQMVAQQLGWHLLDSGSLYRITAYAAGQRGIALDDSTAVAQVARNLDVRFESAVGGVLVILQNQDVSAEIRTEEGGRAASVVAADAAVRAALIDRQRDFAKPPGLVADGRDMGSVVFSSAGLKIFLTASVQERARRRYKQLKDKGMDVSLPALSRDMEERDRRDSQRSVAPLRAAEDARVLDSTDLDVQEVVDLVIFWASEVYSL
ncbi:MAG: (d)CMP kinase [Gammaproteobacteria bacterium]|nr:(d)CMP kinase [Gammaproteobacteria bacterium]MCP4090871.1 (d)CMP kinase [Gammaproteobacteria bacterium]MCP4275521.1 (d)CMP kinase [Gammaproteobacteria bacterium]MCP4832243.1 (d)CMP kinase [Gammaproteobacteria bacterium]MCP4930297.1 (d)CMP kinase [Gammaproteobacteria bacterium]